MSHASVCIAWTPEGGAERQCTFTERCTIGRGLHNRIILPEAEVSRSHAVLELTSGGLVIRNLSRQMPIRISGSEVVGPGDSTTLGKGASFRVGDSMLTVRDLVIPAPMLRCVNPTCRRLVSPDLPDCPWCGTSLAFAQTHVGG